MKCPRLFTAVVACGLTAAAHADTLSLTLLHNNDAESFLLPQDADGNPLNGAEERGISRFVGLVNQQRAAAASAGSEVLTLSAGDNFLAGSTWKASLNAGTFFDAQAMEAIDYDAVVIGNHEFDFGPGVLSDFINAANDQGVSNPFISANLNLNGHPGLTAQQAAGNLATSTVVNKGGRNIGIVGATTDLLSTISNPGVVSVDPVQTAVQNEINRLRNDLGAETVVFVSHLQSINNDLDLIPNLSGVDIAIAGGGDNLLASPGDPLLPSDAGAPIFSNYPNLVASIADPGKQIPVVTTTGQYGYLGKLVVDIDTATGEVTVRDADSLPLRNFGPDGIPEDPTVKSEIEQPVADFVAAFDSLPIATTAFDLNGRREDVRTRETNVGNLVADALVFNARQEAADFGINFDNPIVGVQNGGGIRNSVTVTDGVITAGDIADMLPFGNTVGVVEDLPVQNLAAALENAVSNVENVDGRFLQVAGIRFSYDPDAEVGQRVVDAFLESDTNLQIIDDGEIIRPNQLIDLVTIDFLLGDRDGFEWNLDGIQNGIDFTNIPVTYDQALENYLVDALNGDIESLFSQYQEGGEGRIQTVPEPATVAVMALAAACLLPRGRRRA